MFKEIFWIALAGAAGSLSRYGLGGLVQWLLGEKFPWGTLVVNTTGCFLFGLVWAMAEERMVISGQTRIIVLVGFMGAFTTFSTFAFETSEFLRDAEWGHAVFNILMHNMLGIVCMFLGFAVGRKF